MWLLGDQLQPRGSSQVPSLSLKRETSFDFHWLKKLPNAHHSWARSRNTALEPLVTGSERRRDGAVGRFDSAQCIPHFTSKSPLNRILFFVFGGRIVLIPLSGAGRCDSLPAARFALCRPSRGYDWPVPAEVPRCRLTGHYQDGRVPDGRIE